MGVVVRRYIDILTIIINFPYSTCISSFVSSSIPTSLFILKCFFGLYIYHPPNSAEGLHFSAFHFGGFLVVVNWFIIIYIYYYYNY